MISRFVALLLLPALLLLVPSQPAAAQWGAPPQPGIGSWMGDDLAGTYYNPNARAYCRVSPRRGGYLFVNENGSPAWFAYWAPGQLRMVRGEWDPNIVVTVSRDAMRRTMLRFDSPMAPTGYWVRVD